MGKSIIRYWTTTQNKVSHCAWETIHSFYLQLLQVLIDVQIHIIYLFQIDIIIPCLFRRSRIRSLLTYFCYGRCCLAILKMKIFSNFLIGEYYKFGRSSENGVKMFAVIFRLCFFGPNIGPSPNVKKDFPPISWGKIPNSVVIKLFVKTG